MEGLDGGVERETAVARLDAGVVEYRLERRGETSVLVFHGGHMRAGLPLGEEVFAELGCTVLVPSRPGYGRTPVGTGRSPAGFADASRELCRHLGIEGVDAVVGVSAGGRTAMAMAARHPELVRR
ncbi:alpha/beta fold hydrolase, partial [Actinopolymorpha pittospori]